MFFKAMSAKGGLHGHLIQLELQYRLRSHILGNNEQILSDAAYVQFAKDSKSTTDLDDTELLSEFLKNKSRNEEHVPEENDLIDLQHDSLEYLAGYLIKWFKASKPDIIQKLSD